MAPSSCSTAGAGKGRASRGASSSFTCASEADVDDRAGLGHGGGRDPIRSSTSGSAAPAWAPPPGAWLPPTGAVPSAGGGFPTRVGPKIYHKGGVVVEG